MLDMARQASGGLDKEAPEAPGDGADCQRCVLPDSATDHESRNLPMHTVSVTTANATSNIIVRR